MNYKYATKRRSELNIIIDILNVVTMPTLKTHLMYKTNLSYYQRRYHCDKLLRYNLIEYRDNAYIITDKGKIVLDILTHNEIIKELSK